MTIADSLSASIPSPLSEGLRARDIMTTELFTVDARTYVIDAAELMVARGVSNAPVVKTDFTRQMLVGFISEKDVLQCYATGRLYEDPHLRVENIMRSHPIAVRPEADLFSLAAIFMHHNFRHVPVVRGEMIDGMVSRRDVLKALLEHYRDWQKLDPTLRRAPDVSAMFAPQFLIG